MARNSVAKMDQQMTKVEQPQGDVPPLPGGTLGVPTVQALPAGMVGAGRRRQPDPPSGRQFEIVGGPQTISYPGQGKMPLRVGKVVSTASCDVEHLRRQGVKLKEVVPEPPIEDLQASASEG